MELSNQIAIVTGAARGIGKAIALILAREGANVVITDIHLDEAKKVVEKIVSMGAYTIGICSPNVSLASLTPWSVAAERMTLWLKKRSGNLERSIFL